MKTNRTANVSRSQVVIAPLTAVLFACLLLAPAFAQDNPGAGKRIAEKWVGEKKLSAMEIQEDEFLSAAA